MNASIPKLPLLLGAAIVSSALFDRDVAAAQVVQPAATASGAPAAPGAQTAPEALPPGATPSSPSPGRDGSPPSEADESKFRTRFTNTLRYTLGLRTGGPSSKITSDINLDDGDRNFRGGSLMSNRADLFSELDIQNRHIGVRFSGEAWYDPTYRGLNGNNSPSTINQYNTPFNQFVPETRNELGQGARALDAFAFTNFKAGKAHIAFRAGRHAILWGQTLFFGSNGIANAMAPIDITKALSVPDAQFKELILPTTQLSTEIQLNQEYTIGAFYGLQWQRDLFPPVGSYFSPSDGYDRGAQRLFAGPPPAPGAPPLVFGAGAYNLPRNTGQFGIELLVHPPKASYDLGLYALQYTEKILPTEIVSFGPGPLPGQIGQFYPFFPQGIHTYGVSFSTTINAINFATEISVRNNAPLNSNGLVCGALPGLPPGFTLPCGDTSTHPIYPVGDTLHANASILWTLPPLISKESTLAFEIAYNNLLKVSANRQALSSNSTDTAAAIRAVYTPVYRQVRPGVDLSLAIGAGTGLFGKSASLVGAEFPGGGVGDFEIGPSVELFAKYTAALRYTGFFGPAGTFNDPAGHVSYQQYDRDRSFLTLTLSRSI